MSDRYTMGCLLTTKINVCWVSSDTTAEIRGGVRENRKKRDKRSDQEG